MRAAYEHALCGAPCLLSKLTLLTVETGYRQQCGPKLFLCGEMLRAACGSCTGAHLALAAVTALMGCEERKKPWVCCIPRQGSAIAYPEHDLPPMIGDIPEQAEIYSPACRHPKGFQRPQVRKRAAAAYATPSRPTTSKRGSASRLRAIASGRQTGQSGAV